ncbi:hypothetical protein K9M74_00855 [Candidatus Woesearchaeota archaeon]|nr:hypothetical protein [Candidatus Woesearchaeota archaeon]
MIRFPEIWKRYEQGELKRLEPEKPSSTKIMGYKDLDASSQAINQIASFQSKPLLKKINSLPITKPSIPALEKILEPIEAAEKNIADKVDLFELHGHFIRVIKLGDAYDNFILGAEIKNYLDFDFFYTNLKNGKNESIVQKKREQVDSIHEVVVGLHRLAQRRKIDDEIPYMNKQTITEYSTTRNEINKIKGNIARIKEEYEYTDLLSKKGQKDIKELQHEIKQWWKKDLITNAKAIGYVEGVAELKDLHELLKDARKHPKEYQVAKRAQQRIKQQTQPAETITPYEVKQEETKQPVSALEPEEKTPQYSLSMHLFSIGYPQNFQYFPLRSSLVEQDAWPKRFERFNKYLTNLTATKAVLQMSTEDKTYLKSIAEGMYLAAEKPEPDFPVKTAKETYKTLQTLSS